MDVMLLGGTGRIAACGIAVDEHLSPDPAQSVKVNAMGGDTDGIGHFKARNDTGTIIYSTLNGDCKKISCQGPYRGGPVQANLNPHSHVPILVDGERVVQGSSEITDYRDKRCPGAR